MSRAVNAHDPASTYAAVLDALPIVAWMGAPDGSITYVSAGWQRFTGNALADLRERGWGELVHPDDLAHVVETWDAARATAGRYRDEFRLRYGDTAYRHVISQGDPMRENGEVVGWFGTVTDIHDLRLAEQRMTQALGAAAKSAEDAALRAHFAERLMDASDDCITVLDLNARLVSMSANGQRALAILDFMSLEGADWLTFWHGDDRVAATAAVDAARAGGRGRFTGMYAVEGKEKWWDVSITPILDANGAPDQLLAVSRDVTERIENVRAIGISEERHRLIGEALPGVTWTATPDGELDHIVGSETERLPVDVRLGHRWLQTVHPSDRERTREIWTAALASGEPYEATFRVLVRDGTYRWQFVRAHAQRSSDGSILRWIGVNVDVDDQRRADEAREQFVRLAEASDDFVAIAGDSGVATYVNAAGRALLGLAPHEIRMLDLTTDFVAPDLEDGGDVASILARDGRWSGPVRARHAVTGDAIPVFFNVFALFDENGERTGIAAVARDLRDRYRVEAGLRALAEAGAAMYGSLDFSSTARNVADAVAQSFASACTVDEKLPDGTVRSVISVTPDLETAQLRERAAAARNAHPDHPVRRALDYGESTLIERTPDDWFERFGVTAAVGNDAHRLDVRSMIFVPIRSQQAGTIIGTLSCSLNACDPRGHYSPEDLRFAEEIAARAAVAFDHARAYERERRIAVSLQEAQLPGNLPAPSDLTLSADYRPGKSEATIGGDWYDAFVLDDGRVVMTIGDVLGKGLAAAVVMGKARQAMQSVGMVLHDPNVMLAAADRTVRLNTADSYATALAGIFDPARHEFTFASAGHPGPVLRRSDGSIAELSVPGMMLGLRSAQPTPTVTVSVPPGSTLVFFTDGLVEATRNMDEGYRRLGAALADADVLDAAEPAFALVEHVLAGEPASDDIAVLVAQIGPRPAVTGR